MRLWKVRHLGIGLVLILSSLAWSGDSDLKLELDSTARTLRRDERTTLQLRITGPTLERLTAGSEGIEAGGFPAGAFVYQFGFRPPREGRFTFGPYHLTFNGQALTSNALTLTVLPVWEGGFGTFFRVDRAEIPLGEKIELTMETWGADLSLKDSPHCRIRPDQAFAYVSGGSSMSVQNFGTETQKCCCRQWWWITPKQPGEFRITRDLFAEFPAGIEVPNLTVVVKEPPQAAGASK